MYHGNKEKRSFVISAVQRLRQAAEKTQKLTLVKVGVVSSIPRPKANPSPINKLCKLTAMAMSHVTVFQKCCLARARRKFEHHPADKGVSLCNVEL